MAFTNYFLLHQQNMNYYEGALSVLPRNTKKILWDEYYLHKDLFAVKGKKGSPTPRNGTLSRLMNNPSFGAAVWLLFALLLIYALQEMRRKQRVIPAIAPPRNDSLEFVRTIGRLYFEKGDHKNLARKMSAYFLEHVRTRYKLLTNELDDKFLYALQMKSGYSESGIRQIMVFIRFTEDAPSLNDQDLADFHNLLEDFYRQTE
jgi:hypothetical protein